MLIDMNMAVKACCTTDAELQVQAQSWVAELKGSRFSFLSLITSCRNASNDQVPVMFVLQKDVHAYKLLSRGATWYLYWVSTDSRFNTDQQLVEQVMAHEEEEYWI